MRKATLFTWFISLVFTCYTAKGQTIDTFNKAVISGDYNRIIKNGLKLDAKEPNNSFVLFQIGRSYKNLNKFRDADSFLMKAATQVPSNIEYANLYAENLYEIGYRKKAINKYEQILIQDSLNLICLNNLSKAYIKTKDYNKALKLYSKLWELDTTNTFYLNQSAYCSIKLKKTKNAILFYKRAYLTDTLNIKSIRKLSNILLLTKKYDEALVYANKGIQVAPEISDFYRIKGSSFFGKK